MAKGQLVIWSARQRDWLICPPDEITWLDRKLLSAGQDPTLHRSPRCAGLRYVHYRWELFSRDTTHRVYLAPFAAGSAMDYRAVQATARHVLPQAPGRISAYFERNDKAAMAMAYYYQQFILGAVAPQEMPMAEVAIALDLNGEGAVSDYKKELQRRIWNEQRHQRDLAGFLLANGLIGPAELDRANRAAAANERSGRSEMARQRLRYRPKKK